MNNNPALDEMSAEIIQMIMHFLPATNDLLQLLRTNRVLRQHAIIQLRTNRITTLEGRAALIDFVNMQANVSGIRGGHVTIANV